MAKIRIRAKTHNSANGLVAAATTGTTRLRTTRGGPGGSATGGAGNGGTREVATDYRHASAKRKNNPPAKIAAEGYVPLIPKAEYFYSPRRPPELRFDPTGGADELPELLAKATEQKLTEAEASRASGRINPPGRVAR